MNIINDIRERITGRLAVTDGEALALYDYVQKAGGGLHLEIGCLYGGTAIIAALAGAEVITIDPMRGGWWEADTPDPATGISPNGAIVHSNFIKFGVNNKVTVIPDYSYNYIPKMLEHPTTALIDGDHSRVGSLADWLMLSPIVKKYILVHDYDPVHPGVIETIEKNIYYDPSWKMVDLIEHMAIFERVQNA